MTTAGAAVGEPFPTTQHRGFDARLLGWIWGLWIGLFPILDFIFRPSLSRTGNNFEQVRVAAPQLAFALVSLALSSSLIAAFGAARLGLDFRRAKLFAPIAALFCIIIPLSLLPTSDSQNIIYVVLVFNLFISLMFSISTNLNADAMLRSMFVSVALAHCFILIVVLIDADYSWGRLYGHNAANYWGFLSQTALIATIAMRGWILRLGVVVLALVIIYLTQSRGSMVAAAAGLSAAFVLYAWQSRARVWLWLSAAIALVMVAVLGFNFITDDLLRLSDPGRGIGSGASGRANVWRESFDLFANHPWLGVGYRQHEQYLTSEANAHDAYLGMLADTGVLGLMAYLIFLFGGLARSVVRQLSRPTPSNLATVAFLTAFVVNGLFERSALNTGNAYCQMMALLAAWAWRTDPAPRTIATPSPGRTI
jgi:O-antigen ligase